MTGCAIPTSSAGHTTRRAQADNALTFNLDHSTPITLRDQTV